MLVEMLLPALGLYQRMLPPLTRPPVHPRFSFLCQST